MTEDTNDYVNRWIIDKFKAEYSTDGHLATCPSLKVVGCEHGYECNCYSEYTRDDEWTMTATLGCDHGQTSVYRAFDWSSLPQVIEALRSDDLSVFECPYDDVDEEE